MNEVTIQKGVTPYIRGFYWNEEGKYYQLNREEFKILTKELQALSENNELPEFIKKNLENFYWIECKTRIKNFCKIILNNLVVIIVDGILRNDNINNIYSAIDSSKFRQKTKQSFMASKTDVLKIISYFLVATKFDKDIFENVLDKVNVIYKIFVDKLIANSRTCSKKHEDIFSERLLFDKNFKPEFFLKSIIDILEARYKIHGKHRRKFLLICVVFCLMLKSACRISSIWQINVEEMKSEQIKFKIGKKKGEQKNAYYCNIDNFEFLQRICQNENFQQHELKALFAVDNGNGVKFQRSVTRLTELCFKTLNVENAYYEFFLTMLKNTHIARNWTINKLALMGFDSYEISSLTCQTVDVIEKSYVSEVVKDQANKNNKAKIHKYHCELFGVD